MSGSDNEIANTGGPASSAEPSMEEILASIRRILKDDQTGAEATGEPEPVAETGAAEDDDDILVLDATMIVKPAEDLSPIATPDIDPGWTPEPEEFQQPEPIAAEPIAPEIENQAFEPQEAEQPHLSSELPEALPDTETLDLPAPDSTLLDSTGTETPSPEINSAAPDSLEATTMSDNPQNNVQPPHGLISEEASNAAAGSIGALIRSISSDRSVTISRPGLTLEDLVREEIRPLLKSWLDTNLPSLVERIVRAEIERVIERSV